MPKTGGMVSGHLRLRTAGVLISTVDTEADLYEPTSAWRDASMSGILHSVTLVTDERSEERARL